MFLALRVQKILGRLLCHDVNWICRLNIEMIGNCLDFSHVDLFKLSVYILDGIAG